MNARRLSPDVLERILPNGLRVVSVHTPALHAGFAAVYVRAGSRHETPETSGVSHFLEHMFFRGCACFPTPREMHALIEDAGGGLNAATARDHSFYYTTVHEDGLELTLQSMGAMLSSPLFQPEDVELEREIILQEILDEVDERGQDISIENLSKRALFAGHPLSLPIGGTRESVQQLRREQIEAHFRRMYVARNMVLCVVSPASHATVQELAALAFSHLPSGDTVVERHAPAWPRAAGLTSVLHSNSQVQLRLCFPIPVESNPRFPVVVMLQRVLTEGFSSRLQTLVEQTGLAYSIQAGVDTFADAAVLEIDSSSSPDKTTALAQRILECLADLTETGVTPAELARAQGRYRRSLDYALDSPSDLADWFGGTRLFYQPPSLEMRRQRIEAVTTEALRQLARDTFRDDACAAFAVGPLRGSHRRALEKALATTPFGRSVGLHPTGT